MFKRSEKSTKTALRRAALGLALLLLIPLSAQASPMLNIDEFTWDDSTGVASLSGSFDMDSYTGEKWRLTRLEIMVGSTVYSSSLAPYSEYTSLPFSYSFDDVTITPAPLTVGNTYQVGISMQRYFSFLSGWESGSTIFSSNAQVTAVPEPTTAVLLGLGLTALAARRRRI